MAWLDYNEHVDSLCTMDNEVGVTTPENTIKIILSFEKYTLSVTYPEEVEKTLETPMEIEPLNETKLLGIEDLFNLIMTMRMERYLAHTDYTLWEVVWNGNSVVQITKDEAEGLDKGYDRFQRLLSLLEIHRAGIDNLDIDDLYNNLKVCEADIKGSSRSSYLQNVAFISAECTSSTNELNAAYSVSTATCHSSQAHEEGTLLESADQPGIRGIGVELLRMHGTEEEIMRRKQLTLLLWLSLQILQAPQAQFLSAKVKTGLGYDNQFHEKEVLDIRDEEVTETFFHNRSSDEENNLANDRFKKGEGYNAVPPPLTGNYMPPKPDLSFAGLDDSIHKFKISETVTSLAKDDKDAPETSTASVEKPKEYRDNTVGSEAVSAIKGNGFTTIKTSAGNKAYLTDYQKINDGGFVAFGSSRGKISGKEFKNRDLDEFYVMKGIKREYRNARTPQQNGVTKRKNMTLIEAARTMLADSVLPITFWVEAVNTACYVLNRALVIKPHNKTPYELLNSRTPRLDFMRAFRFSAANQIDKNVGPQDTNGNACTHDNADAGKDVSDQHYIVLPLWSSISSTFKNSDDKATNDKPTNDLGSNTVEETVNKEDEAYRDELDRLMSQEKEASDARTLYLGDDDDLDIFDSLVQSVGAEADFNNMESSTIVTPKLTHLHVVKRIFRYLKGQPKLGLWYLRDSLFDLEAYSNSDYAETNLDRKSITGGCQFLGRRLISRQCKKQTIIATSTTEAEFVDQHNMVACLERIEANVEFHQIVDFLSTCSINYALMVSPTIYASYIEQFKNIVTSKTVNLVKQIHAIVDGKAVVISESSVSTNLFFNDKDDPSGSGRIIGLIPNLNHLMNSSMS
uniref:Ribonuclease H-like domain-containing protein n=1 Tax=Tanacetum cinerariifolium TaxID=118510 RepID=A0A6L2L9J8_TANCI|nr:ribonuclease H-like domain-containing protein [Tanacetum cinerariifolium]